MTALANVTQFIQADEKAYRLAEWNMVRPPFGDWHRWQVIFVNRADKLAEFWTDLGPAANYTAAEFNIPALWEHSVAELQDIATSVRLGDDHWQKFAAEKQAESTLISDFLQQKEEMWKVINNQTVIGPGVSKQRDGFSKRAAWALKGR